KRDLPDLVDDLVPKLLSRSTVQAILRGLLQEAVPVRDMRTILETLARYVPQLPEANRASDVDGLLAQVRVALGRAIVQQWFDPATDLQVIGLDNQLEAVLEQALATSGSLEPGLAQSLVEQAAQAIQRQEA